MTGLVDFFTNQIAERGKDSVNACRDFKRDSIRHLIVANALLVASEGPHYLNSSDGATPGNRDGLKGRELGLVESTEWDTLGIHAARRGSKCCKGRYEKVNGYRLEPHSVELADLEQFVERVNQEGVSPRDFPALDRLYPRRGAGPDSSIYVGEDCRGKRHFDCISFVNWVLTTTLGRPFDYSIVQYEGDKNTEKHVAPVTVHRARFPLAQNADIVTRIRWEKQKYDSNNDGRIDNRDAEKWVIQKKHIGIVTGIGKVIEAKSSGWGVVVSDYRPRDWTALCRLHPAALRFGP